VLLRLLRGAGSRGLSAMRARSGHVLRPLLEVSRTDVLEHLRVRDLRWREDPSNADPALLRNRVRHELLPYLESRFNPAVRETLGRTAAVLAEESDALDAIALPARQRRPDGGVSLGLLALRAVPRGIARLAVRRAIEESGGLRGVRLGHVDRIVALSATRAPSGRRVALPGGREATFHFDELRIGKAAGQVSSYAVALSVPGRVELPDGSALVVEPAGAREQDSGRGPARRSAAGPHAASGRPASGRTAAISACALPGGAARAGGPARETSRGGVWTTGVVGRGTDGGGPARRRAARPPSSRGASNEDFMRERPTVLFTEDQIAARIREIGQEAAREFAGKELCVVGLMKSCMVFLADMVRAVAPRHDLPLPARHLAPRGGRELHAHRHRLLHGDPVRGTPHPFA
jgi:hypothetical protein